MTTTPETFIKALDCAFKFLRQHEFDFTLTGTAALMTQGLLPENYEPHDIDVLAYNMTSEQYKLLRQMENLAGLTNESYADSTTTFTILANGVKLNLLCSPAPRDDHRASDMYVEVNWAGHTVKVQIAAEALRAKLRLCRPKDYVFFNDLISEIWNSSIKK